jgi:tRNA (uracil-5-)-methyltransferase TRM9
MMDSATVNLLLSINSQFYQTFGAAFAATRRRIQPGVRRVLARIPNRNEDWLDLGCGSGALAAEWVRQARQGAYVGVDFSPQLLEEARRTVAGVDVPGLQLQFLRADLSAPKWADQFEGRKFAGVLALAVLHHLPGSALRLQVLRQVHDLLQPGGEFIHSVWQFQHSSKIMARRQDWQSAGIHNPAAQLEQGDTLLDWRHALPEQVGQTGLRYVHLFSQQELADLAAAAGFQITEEFASDGEGGRLGLYQFWQRV